MWALLLLLPASYFWFKYYKQKEELQRKYSESEQHYEKLNSVVMYSKIHGITGWPEFKENAPQISCLNYDDAFKPLLYFINSTKVSLDVAIMTLTSNIIADAIVSLLKAGIKVRLLVDYDHMGKGKILKDLIQSGAEVVIYVGTQNSGSIFHYKYAIKDYGEDFSALYCGSLNWSNAAFLENYEDMVFTTNSVIIDNFYSNYIKSLNYVKQLAEDDLFVKVKLKELYANVKII